VCVKAHPPLLNYIKMRTQAKQIIKIINETSNDYDAVDEVVEFLNKEKTIFMLSYTCMFNCSINNCL
jgi:archaellum biogenesis protein FlaJ (TadC family)